MAGAGWRGPSNQLHPAHFEPQSYLSSRFFPCHPVLGSPLRPLPLPLWEELDICAVSAMSGEDQPFKVDGRSELDRAFTLEAPKQESRCLGEGSLRAGGPAASSIHDTPKGRRAFRVLLDQRSGREVLRHSDPHGSLAGQHGLGN